jgi:hypothetical protein
MLESAPSRRNLQTGEETMRTVVKITLTNFSWTSLMSSWKISHMDVSGALQSLWTVRKLLPPHFFLLSMLLLKMTFISILWVSTRIVFCMLFISLFQWEGEMICLMGKFEADSQPWFPSSWEPIIPQRPAVHSYSRSAESLWWWPVPTCRREDVGLLICQMNKPDTMQ